MNKNNIADLANAVAQENNIEDVVWILEQSFGAATIGYYGDADDIYVIIHPISEQPTWLHWKGDEAIADDTLKNVLENLKEKMLNKEPLDQEQWEILPSVPVDRNLAQKISRDFKRNIDFVKKTKEYEIYHDKIGTIITGSVHSIDVRGNAVITFDNVQGYLPYRELIKKEPLSVGKRIRCVIQSVEEDPKRHQITLSRASPLFFEALLEQIVPEIGAGLIVVNKIVREPGACTKVAISGTEYNIDPVRMCIGPRGARIQTIVQELGGEKVHIVSYDPDILNLAVNTLNIAEVIEAYIEEEERPEHDDENESPDYNRYTIVTIIVPDELKSRAIGASGQNVRLVSKMIGCRVDILSKTEYDKTCNKDTETRHHNPDTQEAHPEDDKNMIIHLINKLNIEYDLAEALVNQFKIDHIEKILDLSIDSVKDYVNLDENTLSILKKNVQNIINEEKFL